jgi:hypothetical protein
MLQILLHTTAGQMSLPAGRHVFRYYAFGSDLWLLILGAFRRVKAKPLGVPPAPPGRCHLLGTRPATLSALRSLAPGT